MIEVLSTGYQYLQRFDVVESERSKETTSVDDGLGQVCEDGCDRFAGDVADAMLDEPAE
jgi:hypothetical protein